MLIIAIIFIKLIIITAYWGGTHEIISFGNDMYYLVLLFLILS